MSTTPVANAPVGAAANPRYSPLDIGLLVLLGGVWGVAYIFIRQGIVLGASPLLYAAARYALSAGAFAAIALARREAGPRGRDLAVSAVVGGVLVIGLYGGFLYWGEQYTSGGFASVLSTTTPILTVAFAYGLLPRERLGALSLVGIGVGLVGAVVLVLPSLLSGPAGKGLGPLFVVGAFVSAALGQILLRRFGGGRQGLWQIGSQFAVGAVLLGAAAAVLPVPEALPLTEGVAIDLLALVALSSVVGYFTYFTLHHRIGPVRANAVTYLIPLVGIGVGSGFYGEAITVWEVVGFLVVLLGMTLVVQEAWRRTPAPSS